MNNILKFYVQANKLKEVLRTGWIEVNIEGRTESVADAVFGSMVLAMAIKEEKNVDVDLIKVFKMLIVKNLEKVTLKEVTTREYPTYEERKASAFETVSAITKDLAMHQEIMDLLEEIYAKETKEAKFVSQVTTIESDIQAKIYDLEGKFKVENALEDAKYYGEELSNEIIPQIKNASDGWILYDRKHYEDEYFKELSEEIQKFSL